MQRTRVEVKKAVTMKITGVKLEVSSRVAVLAVGLAVEAEVGLATAANPVAAAEVVVVVEAEVQVAARRAVTVRVMQRMRKAKKMKELSLDLILAVLMKVTESTSNFYEGKIVLQKYFKSCFVQH